MAIDATDYSSQGLLGGVNAAQTERREGAFDRKLNELNSVTAELESVHRDLETLVTRLLDPRPTPPTGPNVHKIAGEPVSHEAKLDALFRRLIVLRSRLGETVNTLSQAV